MSRCSLVSAGDWRRLTEQLADDEYIEVPATQRVCSLCEVGMFRTHYMKNLNA